MNQKARILSLLKSGRNFTVNQLAGMIGGSPKSVTARVTDLRSEGYAIYTNTIKNGKQAYRLGAPSRSMVRIAHAAAGNVVFQ